MDGQSESGTDVCAWPWVRQMTMGRMLRGTGAQLRAERRPGGVG